MPRTTAQTSAEAPASYQMTPASIIGNAVLRTDGRSVALTLQDAVAGPFGGSNDADLRGFNVERFTAGLMLRPRLGLI